MEHGGQAGTGNISSRNNRACGYQGDWRNREAPIRSTLQGQDRGLFSSRPVRCSGAPTVDNPVWEICERMAEVQALLHDHIECGKHTAAEVIAKAQAVLSETDHLRAMFDVGYFPPNTPPEPQH